MDPEAFLIAVVDDDESVREALRALLRSAGLPVRTFDSAEDLLASGALAGAWCLILDQRMPGMDGLELQRRLKADHAPVPIIFIAAHDDPPVRQRALAAGALDFLHKPFEASVLLKAVQSAVAPRRARLKVLVVDDDATVRTIVETVLARDGFEVLTATDGVEALALLRAAAGAVDLLITDLRMPRMSGPELVRAVRADFRPIPVLYVSGQYWNEPLPESPERAAFLQKPFPPQSILEAVRRLLPGPPASARPGV